MQEYGGREETIPCELPHAQANQGLPVKGRVMSDLPKIDAEWCIVKYYNTDPDRKTEYDLLVRIEHQWTAQRLQGRSAVVARGLKRAEEAMFYLPLYKD